MLTYIYDGKILCEECGRDIRELLEADGKKPIFPDNPWSYDSKDYPKGPYYSDVRIGGPLFSCARCNASFGPLAFFQPQDRIIDPWTDPLPKPPKVKYGDFIPPKVKMHISETEGDRRRRGALPKGN